MKIKTFLYYINQSIKSIIRNKMMSIASITTVMAALFIVGIFYITLFNVNYLIKSVESTVEIKVFLRDDATNNQMSLIESQAKVTQGVTDVSFESKQQALDNFKKQLGDNGDLVTGIDPNKVMPNSYIIKLQGPQYVDGVVRELKMMKGIDKINDARPVINRLMQVTNFIKTIGITIMLILLAISIFIISNTIKLTVFARRREIGIMKYIGATNWFIRWPFIIEGVLLGFLGAIVSGAILGYSYIAISGSLAKSLMVIKLVEPMEIIPSMQLMFLAMGALIGCIGSMLSIRKFLNV